MNPKKTRLISISALAALLSSLSLSAETFLLIDGKSITGTVISSTQESYLIKTETSRNVYGEKTILKTDVVKVTESDPSTKAFKKLSKLLPTADLLTAKAYEMIIVDKLQSFLKKHPESEHKAEVEDILKTIENEHAVIQAGGLKIGGKLLSAADVEMNKYEINAKIDLKNFVDYVARKQYGAALNILEKMENLYPKSNQTRKAQNATLVILPHYVTQLTALRDNVDVLKERRKNSLDTLSPSDRNRTAVLFTRKDQAYEALLEKVKSEKKVKWLPINSYFKKPIETNLKMVDKETKRITKEISQPAVDAGGLYRDIIAALNAGDAAKAEALNETFKDSKQSKMFTNELQEKIAMANAQIAEELKKKAEVEELARQKKLDEEKLAKKKARAEAAAKERMEEKTKKNDPLNWNHKKEQEDKARNAAQ